MLLSTKILISLSLFSVAKGQMSSTKGQSLCERWPKVEGDCRMIQMAYVYNAMTDRCEQRVLGAGCQHDGFTLKTECEDNCQTALPTDMESACQRPQVAGSCEMLIHGWTYSPETGECTEKTIGKGCRSNAMSQQDCKRWCRDINDLPTDPKTRCHAPESVGLCKTRVFGFVYRSDLDTCIRQLIGGGCGSNAYQSEIECYKNCANSQLPGDVETRCNSPEARGQCKSRLKVFVYNPLIGACSLREFSGCVTNGITSFHVCKTVCGVRQRPTRPGDIVAVPLANRTMLTDNLSRCERPQASGQCRKEQQPFIYNPDTDTCVQTNVGFGCATNGFITKEDCLRACQVVLSTNPATMCRSPQIIGSCNKTLNGFVFNPITKDCEQKTIGLGCRSNLIANESLCKQYCRTATDLPMDMESRCKNPEPVGLCKMDIWNFVLNSDTNRCEFKLIGGGCHSNGFSIEDECIRNCRSLTKTTTAQPQLELPTDMKLRCEHPQSTGLCKALMNAFIFNPRHDRCERRVLTGCYTNGLSRDECESECAMLFKSKSAGDPLNSFALEDEDVVDKNSSTRFAAYQIIFLTGFVGTLWLLIF